MFPQMRPWLLVLVACGAPPATRSTTPPRSNPDPPPPATSIGTAHPVLLQELASDGRWMVICQARKDTNGNGVIEVRVGFHGNIIGDSLVPYLVFGAGEGIAIDAFGSRDDDGSRLAYIRGGKLFVSDAEGHATELPGADVREDLAGGDHRATAISRDGTRMIYLRAGKLVSRDLGA